MGERSVEIDGEAVKQHRQKKGMTQNDLARESDLSVRKISQLEGGGSVSPQTLRRVAKALDVKTAELLQDDTSHKLDDALESYVISFDTFIADRSKDFVGREFVFEQFQKFTSNRDIASGYFIIEGDPGIGKSAILAAYVQQHRCIAHFNIRASGINRTELFLRNVCAQVCRRYGLRYASFPPDIAQSGHFFAEILGAAGQKLTDGELLVIVIDALDEVDTSERSDGTNLLHLPETVPNGVFFLVTTRRTTDLPLVIHSEQQILNLAQFPVNNQEDASRYVMSFLDRGRFRAWADRQRMAIDAVVAGLVEKAESNFMYLRYVLPAIERGEYRDLAIGKLPQRLEGYYDDHWDRMGMRARPVPRSKLRILYVLSEVRRPVTRRLLAHFAQEDELAVQEVIDEWFEFLHGDRVENETRFSLYHGSFREFLTRKDIIQATGVTIPEINALIGDYLWHELTGDE